MRSGETEEIYREQRQNEAMLEASVLGQGGGELAM